MCVCACVCVCMRVCVCVARQPPLSMEFSRQQYWSGQPFSSPGNLSNPGIKSGFPALQVDSLLSEPPGKPPLTFLLTDYWVNLGRAHTQALSTDEVWGSQPHPSALGVVTWFKPGPSANPTVPQKQQLIQGWAHDPIQANELYNGTLCGNNREEDGCSFSSVLRIR